jgi:hypothetical protein
LAKLGRIVTVMQAIGAVLAVPFGLTSAYSVYSNNLSTEATCKGLRGSIVTAIDKNVDLDTRRRLIRRDVEAFEQSCAGFDPDALEAFRLVLTKDEETAAAPVAPPPVAESAVPLPVPRPAALSPVQPRREGEHETRRAEARHPDARRAEVKAGATAEAKVPAVSAAAAPAMAPLHPAPEPPAAAAPSVPTLPVAMPAPPPVESPAPPPVAARARPPAATAAWPPAWTPVRPPADVTGAPSVPQPEDEPAPWRSGHLMQ